MFHTVAAVATPRGRGGIAVIRISGADAAAVADRAFRPAGGNPLSAAAPRRAVYGEIVSPATGEVIDTGVAVLYRAPASYTGEDTAEISCHGGAAVTRAVLAAVLEAGAEMAGPGDFTRRAFVNGKLSLSEAEAVGLLIDADTESRRVLASGAARGNLTRALAAIADSLTGVLSALYAAIDYPEEDVGDEGERAFASTVNDARARLSRICDSYRAGRAVAAGLPAVIAGVPNSGKSSLFNALTGADDAIVTDIPGTTRDVLRAVVDAGGATLLLADTAGIRDAGDEVERIGVERARAAAADAAIVFFVIDASVPLGAECRALLAEMRCAAPRAALVAVLNKADLPCALGAEELAFVRGCATETVAASARDGGVDEVRAAAARLAGTDKIDPASDPVIWDERQHTALRRALGCLDEAAAALCEGAPLDAVCTLCESAVADISGVDGRAVDDAIIDGIFARFCVGK